MSPLLKGFAVLAAAPLVGYLIAVETVVVSAKEPVHALRFGLLLGVAAAAAIVLGGMLIAAGRRRAAKIVLWSLVVALALAHAVMLL